MPHVFDPNAGNCGRGSRDITPADLDLKGFEPYRAPGSNDVNFPIYGEDGEPDGWMWYGFIKRCDDGQYLIAGFERPMTPEELAASRPRFSTGGSRA